MDTKSIRVKYSIVLVILGFILSILPQGRSFKADPGKVLSSISDDNAFYTADQVAKMMASEDSTVRFIDLRTEEEYKASCLPGAVNIPYDKFIANKLRSALGNGTTKNIIYSDGDIHSSYILVVARELGFENTRALKGGMNDWNTTVMNSAFSGERISARENALFESRTKAKRIFTEYNSLPDSLKHSIKLEKKKLDGGCE
ncbi:MAG TPA: rhodanese-like domain-containing protein [Bacteroidales bacterium]|jgi:rhodanese-related sulfurtransferase|nr:rhodanese-like domain-containing protein [Bacteroidales bacterium]